MKSESTSSEQRRRPRRWLRALLVCFFLCALTWVLMLTFLQRKVLFPREYVEPLANPGATCAGLERWQLDTPEGKVEAFYLPAPNASAAHPGPALLFAHGNGELIDFWPEAMEPYRELGLSVLLPEYRGYGRSQGDPSQEAITADFVRFYDLLAGRPEVDASRIVFHGRSLGGGALCALGAERQPAAYILESTFTSVRAVARRFLVPGFLVRDPFDSLEVIERFDGPVLVLHGKQDGVIPFEHGERLARAAKSSTFVPRTCGHNDCPQDAKYWGVLEEFLRKSGIVGGQER